MYVIWFTGRAAPLTDFYNNSCLNCTRQLKEHLHNTKWSKLFKCADVVQLVISCDFGDIKYLLYFKNVLMNSLLFIKQWIIFKY